MEKIVDALEEMMCNHIRFELDWEQMISGELDAQKQIKILFMTKKIDEKMFQAEIAKLGNYEYLKCPAQQSNMFYIIPRFKGDLLQKNSSSS